jgi:hypothetical protein
MMTRRAMFWLPVVMLTACSRLSPQTDVSGTEASDGIPTMRPWRYQGIPYVGSDALKQILFRLEGYAGSQELARGIARFYGDYLELYENPLLNFSATTTGLKQDDSMQLEYISIELGTSTPSLVESLVHELLHLIPWMRGWPIPYRPDNPLPFEVVQFGDPAVRDVPLRIYDRIRHETHNVLAHEMMIDEFIGFGFARENFIRSVPPENLEEIVTTETRTRVNLHPALNVVSFSQWSSRYLFHWMATRHGRGAEAERKTDDVIEWGRMVHPDLPNVAAAIRALVISGGFRDLQQYPIESNNLLKLMKVPPYTKFVVLEGRETGRPVGVEWATPIEKS